MKERGPGRGAPAPLRYPDFLGIGAQKAGTTWLHGELGRHPDLWVPPILELHYFNAVQRGRMRNTERAVPQPEWIDKAAAAIARVKANRNLNSPRRKERLALLRLLKHRELTDEWYGSVFRAAPEHAKCGEKTPEYALLPDAGFEHILSLNPATKFLFTLRDPIDRAWSQLRMLGRNSDASSTYAPEVLRHVDKSQFIARSDFMPTIDRVRKFVPENRLLILYFDDLVADPAALLKRAYEFIGVDPGRAPSPRLEARHVGEDEELTPQLYGRLKELLRPAYARLEELGSPAVARWTKRHYDGTV